MGNNPTTKTSKIENEKTDEIIEQERISQSIMIKQSNEWKTVIAQIISNRLEIQGNSTINLEFIQFTKQEEQLCILIATQNTSIELQMESKDQFHMWSHILLNFTNIIDTLPRDVINIIFLQFDFQTLGKCACVSKKWMEISSSDSLWIHLYSKHYWRDDLTRESRGWKAKYKKQLEIEREKNLNSPKVCCYCERIYKESQNNENSCRYHRGKWTKHPIYRVAWSCCGNLNYNSPGCMKAFHSGEPTQKRKTTLVSRDK